MTLQDMMNQITDLGTQIRAAANQLAASAASENTDMAELEKQQTALDAMQKRMSALQASYQTMQAAQQPAQQPQAQEPAEKPSVTAMRKSNEYARAFAYAIRNGINPRNGMGNERVKILYDAMTEGGGSPAGTDGGFLVPIDIDNQIRELRRGLVALADHFGHEEVTAPTGWRVVDTAPTTGMPAVNEMGTIPSSSSDTGYDQPAFAKVTYTVGKYGLIVPCSNELMNDNVANLFAYLARWFAKKQVITENGLILTALRTLTASALNTSTVDGIAGIKAVLNKILDPALSVSAKIFVNQDGFDYLDQLVDDNGRGLLQPDPTNATLYKVLGRQVVVLSNAQLPTDTTGTDPVADCFIGEGYEFGTLFVREGFEVTSTDIGGNAWRSDSTEIRGICRMGFSKFDAAAMARRSVTM